MERWMMRDPALVYERIEAIRRREQERSKEDREERARKELKALFEESANVEHRRSKQRD